MGGFCGLALVLWAPFAFLIYTLLIYLKKFLHKESMLCTFSKSTSQLHFRNFAERRK